MKALAQGHKLGIFVSVSKIMETINNHSFRSLKHAAEINNSLPSAGRPHCRLKSDTGCICVLLQRLLRLSLNGFTLLLAVWACKYTGISSNTGPEHLASQPLGLLHKLASKSKNTN